MLSAILDDFSQCPDVNVITLLGSNSSMAMAFPCHIAHPSQEREQFQTMVKAADATFLIAPEQNGILHERAVWAEEVGGQLWSCPSSVIRLAADKLTFHDWASRASIPSPFSVPLSRATESFKSESYPLVVKPVDGVGSEEIFVLTNKDQIARAMQTLDVDRFLAQPRVYGIAASIAFLVGPTTFIPLIPGFQKLDLGHQIRYSGGEMPLPCGLQKRAIALGSRVLKCLPDARGYIGIDLVLGGAENGSEDYVIEVNPRLTTSYVGLRNLSVQNLAKAIKDLFQIGDTPNIQWLNKKVSFDTHGLAQVSEL